MTLQERLRALTAPCRELDAEISVMFGWTKETREDQWCEPYPVWTPPNPETVCGLGPPPRYTASLDAVVELVEWELPSLLEPEWSLQKTEHGYWACVGNEYSTASGQAHTIPAVALLLALIEAKGISD